MPSRRSIRLWPAVAVAAMLVLSGCAGDTESPAPDVLHVPADVATVQAAVDQVAEGGTVVVDPGTYLETVTISTPEITLRGAERNEVIIDGEGVRPYGVVSIADGVTVENLTVRNNTFYGVLFTGLHDENGPSAPTADGYEQWDPEQNPPLQRFLVDHVTAANNGLYGIYAFNAQHGVIRDSYASGSADSGFYVGQCVDCDILVTGNVAERNAVGFENANASDSVVVVGNRFSGNRVGMTLLSSYQEAFLPQRANQVVGNIVTDNVEPASPSQADGGFAIGIGLAGAQDNVIARNRLGGNPRAGVVMTHTEDIPTGGNRFEGNAFDADQVTIANTSADRTPAVGNCADATDAKGTAPAVLGPELVDACEGASAPQASVAALDGPDEPTGMSFLQVPDPPTQPNLADDGTSAPLPDLVPMPDVEDIPLPPATLLAELAGTAR